MTILLFGKTGQVACEIQKQATVRALSRAEADLTDPDHCARVIRDSSATCVINAAAYTAVDQAEDDPETAMVVNGHAPAAMAAAAAEAQIPFIHISTDYVFDGSGDRQWQPSDPVDPLGTYGKTKAFGEEAVRSAGGAHLILRTSWVFSAHGSNFVKTMLRLAETRANLTVVDDQTGGPTPAADIAAACLKAAEQFANGTGKTGTYHFAGAPFCSWADFAREIFRQANRDVAVEGIASSAYPTRAVRPSNSRLDCNSLLVDYGIEQPDWRLGLQKILVEIGVS